MTNIKEKYQIDIAGQPHASRLLSAALRSGSSSHSYLFAGPAGTGKRQASLEFAAALCCQHGGCGSCPSCKKALKGSHPDVTIVEPAGSTIKIEQVREVNRTLRLLPGESPARVIIISSAEALGAESANAFLKSLEEPPGFVVFLLLAEHLGRVLPTIVSRCQMVRFGPVPEDVITSLLIRRHGLSVTMAETFARISSGNLSLAESLCTDADLAGRRQRYLAIAARLGRGGWEGAAGELAAEVESASVQVGETAGAALSGAEAAAVPDGFTAAARNHLKQDAHRRAGAARKQELALALGFMESWFRDMMAVAAGAGDAILNKDYELELEDQALPSRLQNYLQALEVIEKTRDKLGYNIGLGLALQAMFYELMEVL
ncbi:MAG: DNA polymerase III subunit delta' [Actinobacteria bacterium]|nr:DNA polymerase III subunit delta' [Actinomycetota bacterium]